MKYDIHNSIPLVQKGNIRKEFFHKRQYVIRISCVKVKLQNQRITEW